MKKVRLVLPLLAVLFAIGAAFGFQPKADDVTAYMPDLENPGHCTIQPNCGASSGTACDVTPVKNSTCGNVDLYRN